MIKQVLGAAAAGILLLSGCELTGWQEPKAPQPYEAVGVTAGLADEAAALLQTQFLPNNGALSLYAGTEQAVELIEQRTAAILARAGYAVQTVLPPEKRQPGDAEKHEEMKPAGTPLMLAVVPLNESDYIEFQITAQKVRWSKVFAIVNGQAAAVSRWNTLRTDENLFNPEEM